MTVSKKIEQIGSELYGEDFNIQSVGIFDVYKATYNRIILGLKRKKSKGVFVSGNVGVGKSAMMKVLQRLFKDTERRFKSVSSYQLRDMSEEMTIGEIKALYGANLKCDLFIDDIGISIDVKRYGNTVNIISEILLERYDLYISSGYKTHITSNIPPKLVDNPKNIPTIEKVYGLRVLDRIKEMCELVIWSGTSLRK